VTAVDHNGEILPDGDVVVLAQKIVPESEGRLIRLADIVPGEVAFQLGREARCAPELAQLILDESTEMLRRAPNAVIVRHCTAHVLANAGIDASHVEGSAAGQGLPWPVDPDARSRAIRRDIKTLCGATLAKAFDVETISHGESKRFDISFSEQWILERARSLCQTRCSISIRRLQMRPDSKARCVFPFDTYT
jgi:F420-0:gamma-glutamyl ligase